MFIVAWGEVGGLRWFGGSVGCVFGLTQLTATITATTTTTTTLMAPKMVSKRRFNVRTPLFSINIVNTLIVTTN